MVCYTSCAAPCTSYTVSPCATYTAYRSCTPHVTYTSTSPCVTSTVYTTPVYSSCRAPVYTVSTPAYAVTHRF